MMMFMPACPLPRRQLARCLALALVLPASAGCGLALAHEAAVTTASQAGDEAEPVTLAPVRVYALGLDEDPLRQSTPHGVLDGDELLRRGDATLGSSLAGLPGVHADTFGGGASRPVIRGQTAPRVSVLSDGSALFDASAISPDHAVTADPLLTRRVEVLRGPATLLYGGGAIGGVVNVLDNRVPTALPEGGIDGSLALRGNTVAEEKAMAAELTAHLGKGLVAHVERSQRSASDYEISGFTSQRVPGTYAKGLTSSTGLSWVGERGYIGLAYTWQDDEYGLPGHSHEFEGCTLGATPDTLSCPTGGHGHAHGADEVPYVDLRSRRLDLRGELLEPFAGFNALRFRFNRTKYQHDEIEDGAIGTTFLNYGYETRVEAEHKPLGRWHGVIGLQHADSEFNARGTESFVPKTQSESVAVFALEHYELSDDWHLEMGARQEWQRMRPVDDAQGRPDTSLSATSLSLAGVWQFAQAHNLSLSLTRAQRLPQGQELYANGVHLATNTYECGLLACGRGGDVDPETSHNLGLNLRKTEGALTYDIGVYYNRVSDYINADTRQVIDDEFRLIHYTQIRADFVGAEATASYRFAHDWKGTLFGDVVRAENRDTGDALPRIAPARLGARLARQWRGLEGELEFYRGFAQHRVASHEGETGTPGYDMLNLTFSYALAGNPDYTVFLRGSNLLAETVWNHTSFLADRVPEPGRNLSAGIRLAF